MNRSWRRQFLITAGALLAAPLVAQAQQPGKAWRIGVLHVGDHVPPALETLREGLKVMGYEEGKNLLLDFRNFVEEQAARETANEFVKTRVDLIVAFGNPAVRAAKAATSEVPIVFVRATDPVADGFVRSLSRPGGNLTGLSGWGDVLAKQFELYTELMPKLRRVLVVSDSKDPTTPRLLAEIRRAGATLKLQLVEREAQDAVDIERLFASVKRDEVDGVFVVSPNLHIKFSDLMIRLAAGRRLPVPAHRSEWVERGALFSYAPDLRSAGSDAARYVDKILKGTKPAELPVEQPTRYELVVNLKTAKALSITIPQSVRLRADRVIE